MDYKIIYSSRRSLAIQINKSCDVIVRAPYGISKDRIDSFILKNQEWISKHIQRQKEFSASHPEPTEAELDYLKSIAKSVILPKVELYSRIMGVYPASVSINKAKTRYGSCSGKGRINFSCRVMKFPDEAIDYVVVHELAHLKHLNHSKDFWSFVGKFIPDYKERKKLLKA